VVRSVPNIKHEDDSSQDDIIGRENIGGEDEDEDKDKDKEGESQDSMQ
jgi:hypothetical protein